MVMSSPIRFLGVALILVHLAISTFHGQAHQAAMVALTPFGYVYVLLVITAAPLVAGGLLLSRWAKMGGLLLALPKLGSLGSGGWYHFLQPPNVMVPEINGPCRPPY